MDWFLRGEDAFEKARLLAEERESGAGPFRFFLKPGTSALVTFVDNAGIGLLEHNMKINGRWGNFYTCLRDFSECPLCESGDKPYYVMIWTIIDHSKYVSERTGKEYKNTKKLLVAKQSVITKIRRRLSSKELNGDLTFATFSFSRDKREECATGEDIEFVRRCTRDELLRMKPEGISVDEWLTPFDYRTLFKPKSVEELRRIAGLGNPIGYEPGSKKTFGASVDADTGLEALL